MLILLAAEAIAFGQVSHASSSSSKEERIRAVQEAIAKKRRAAYEESLSKIEQRKLDQEKNDRLVAARMVVWITISRITEEGVMGNVFKSIVDYDTYKLMQGPMLPGKFFIHWKAPQDAVDGETYRLVVYDCGEIQKNGEFRTRVLRSDPDEAWSVLSASSAK